MREFALTTKKLKQGDKTMTKYNYEQAMNLLSNGDNSIENEISKLVAQYSNIDETTNENAYEEMAELATKFFALCVNLNTAIMEVSAGTNWASYDYVKYGIEIRDPEQKKVSDLNLFLALIGSEMLIRRMYL